VVSVEEKDIALLSLSEDNKKLFVTFSYTMQCQFDTGSILIDFLEMDSESFSFKYMKLISIINTIYQIRFNEHRILIDDKEYSNLKKIFLGAARICFDDNVPPKYKAIEKGSTQQRYCYYTLKINPDIESDLQVNLKLAPVLMPHVNGKQIDVKEWKENIRYASLEKSAEFILNTEPKYVDTFYFYTLADVLYFEFMNVIKGNVVIRRCKNCNRYFVPSGRSDAKYCNELAPGSEKSCAEIGAIKQYEKRLKNNLIIKAYRKEYKKRYARVLNGKLDRNTFFEWSENAKTKRDKTIILYQKLKNESKKEKLLNCFIKSLENN
jgi:hypothetical protein